ncbi:hypothetical protein V044_02089 [Staphylococcus aureus S56_POEL]|nr:hypothetical protein V044_02089 [Staphylococcus aureus S56_POEL]
MTNRENPTPLKFLSYIIGLSMILLITLFISTLIGDAKIQGADPLVPFEPKNRRHP